MNVGQILTLRANKFPGRIAILFENQRFNYRLFNERVNRLSLASFHMGLSGAPWAKVRGSSTGFVGFRTAADDPPKPWRRWVCILGTTGLPVELH